MKTLKKIIYLLSSEERKNACFLLVLILFMALLDMIGVASILPFMAVLTNPDIIETNVVVNKMFLVANSFGIETNQQFLFVLGILVFMLLVISLIFKALMIYLQIRFTIMREYTIGKRLVEGYLHQPYSWFLNRNSADLGKNILSEVTSVISNGISPMLSLIAHGAVALSLITLLIITDPKLALISCLTLGIAYGLIYKFTRGLLNHIGQQRFNANQLRFSAVSEAFSAVKEVKIGGLEKTYIQRFSKPAQNYAKYMAMAGAIGQIPRYAIEIITFGGMLLVVLYLLSQSSTFLNVVPVIALYAFTGYRLMPALQQIYLATTNLRFIGPALDNLYKDMTSLQKTMSHKDISTLQLKKNITLNHIHYNYPNASTEALKDIHFSISAGSTVGLIGVTGSGKTTTVDIILGLLQAQQGTLEVDGQVIDKHNCRAWQRSIGYVPQQIYLADGSVSSNIAFGTEPKYIDQGAVEHAAKIANLHEFVTNELSQQYQTKVGERGIRLSGGQRQRIGIARALYHNPQVLILDEATSSLDNLTEKEVMEAVNKISKNITIIMIAHRLSTVKSCDTIYLLEKGKLKSKGTFDEMINENYQIRETTVNHQKR